MTLRDDIAVLEDRRFRWFFIGRAVSTVGSSMTAVALAFAVLQIGSATDLGLVMAVFSVCQIAFLVIGGVLADRLPRAVIIQSTYALTAVTQAMVATLFLTGAASIPRLLVLEGINGAAMAFTMPAMQGLVPQLVPHQHLQQATALMSFVRSSAMIGGPVVGGALVVGPGPGWALAVDALTFVVAIACFSRIRLPRAAGRATSMLADLRAGWSEFTSRTWLWVIVLAFGCINAIHAGAWIVLGPVVASEHPDALGARGWGMVLSAEAAGGILMTVVLMRLRIGRPLLLGMLAVSAMVVPLSILGVHPATVPLMVAALRRSRPGDLRYRLERRDDGARAHRGAVPGVELRHARVLHRDTAGCHVLRLGRQRRRTPHRARVLGHRLRPDRADDPARPLGPHPRTDRR
jgi:MFS family permease